MGESEQASPVWTRQEIEVIPSPTWWWITWSAISFLAIFLNLLFLVIVIKNRKTRDFRSLLTATLVTISVLDILDITRIVPSIITNLHTYREFRIVYCSIGVFHTMSVALLLLLAGFYLLCPCRDAPPLYYPASKCSGSLPQKILIPLFVAIGAGVGGVVAILPSLHSSIVDRESRVPHSCVDPTRLHHFWELYQSEGVLGAEVWSDVYQVAVTATSVLLPLLIIPVTVMVSCSRACLHGHCCQVKYKQNAGELLLVILTTIFYLGSTVGSILPKLDEKMEELEVSLTNTPVLWEIANAAARPLIYFLTNPAVWDGLKAACCSSRRSYGSLSTKEDEVALQPVVERISSL